MRPPECLLGLEGSQADTYDRRRTPFHLGAKFDRGLERRGEVEEKARMDLGSLLRAVCSESRTARRIPIQITTVPSGGCRTDPATL
ncbi:hypothetical protein Leryth_022776 [Lithospermum erythrorhizon]|nr:hypothetical protein Leryth_022776 [Lithospermum erythrorhizon]